MLELIRENLILMLTGSTMAFFGGLIYTSAGSAFLSGGIFRNKFEALIIFLISIPIMSVITLFVQKFWVYTIAVVSIFDLLGLVLILGMLGVNHTVSNWTYFDIKSLIVYLIGFLLIYFL